MNTESDTFIQLLLNPYAIGFYFLTGGDVNNGICLMMLLLPVAWMLYSQTRLLFSKFELNALQVTGLITVLFIELILLIGLFSFYLQGYPLNGSVVFGNVFTVTIGYFLISLLRVIYPEIRPKRSRFLPNIHY